MSSKGTTASSSKKSFNETRAFFQNLSENKSKPTKSSSKSIPQPAPKRKSLTLTEKWAKFNKAETDEKSAGSSKLPPSVRSKPRASTSSQKIAVKNESPPPVSSIPNTSSPLTSSSHAGYTSAVTTPASKLELSMKKCMSRGCFTQIPATLSFKRCPTCREKERMKARVKKDRTRLRSLQEEHARLLHERHISEGSILMEGKMEDEDEEMQDAEALALLGERGIKRKAPPKLLNEFTGDNLRKAVKVMKKGVRRLIAELDISVPAETVNSNLTEYQTASDLYESMRLGRASAAPGTLAFVGHHTIIAMSTISNAKRAQFVSKDLRKLVKIPFEYTTPLSSKSDLKCPTTHVTRFKCTCLATKKALGAAAQQAQPQVECGGRIIVTVSDDKTHPHFVGQKIEVRVRHTK